MFRVKICGITTVEDALLAAEAGADAIGLNFYERSPRYVTSERAKEICEALPAGIVKVGVFVNSVGTEVLDTAERVGLTAQQLHEGRGPDFVPSGLPKIRAVRCRDGALHDLLILLQQPECLDAILLDAYAPDKFGGTGQVLDWEAIHDEREKLCVVPLILAGGLTAENVAEAIRIAEPDAVDTASGVESAPGKKDPAKVYAFVEAAKRAFAALSERRTLADWCPRPSGEAQGPPGLDSP